MPTFSDFQVSQGLFNQLYQNLIAFQSLGHYHNVLKWAGDLEAWKGKLYHLDKLYFCYRFCCLATHILFTTFYIQLGIT